MEPTVFFDEHGNTFVVTKPFSEPELYHDPLTDPLAFDVKPKLEPLSLIEEPELLMQPLTHQLVDPLEVDPLAVDPLSFTVKKEMLHEICDFDIKEEPNSSPRSLAPPAFIPFNVEANHSNSDIYDRSMSLKSTHELDSEKSCLGFPVPDRESEQHYSKTQRALLDLISLTSAPIPWPCHAKYSKTELYNESTFLSETFGFKPDIDFDELCFFGFTAPDKKSEEELLSLKDKLQELIVEESDSNDIALILMSVLQSTQNSLDSDLAAKYKLKQCFISLSRSLDRRSDSTSKQAVPSTNSDRTTLQSSAPKLPKSLKNKRRGKYKAREYGSIELPCEVCSKVYSSQAQLTRHQLVHSRKPLSCVKCKEVFDTFSNMKLHMLTHRTEYKCKLCDKVYYNAVRFKDHQQIHTNSSPTCPICKKIFGSAKYVADHIKIHDKERKRNFKCFVCDKAFLTMYKLNVHRTIHNKMLKCSICDFKSCRKSRFDEHLVKHSGIRDHKCTVCGKGYSSSNNLYLHKLTHEPPKYTCATCNYKCKFKTNLYRHVRVRHSSAAERVRLPCSMCKSSFVNNYHLQRHMTIHNLRCLRCDMLYSDVTALRDHMKDAHGGKKHRCKTCSRSFILTEELAKHEEIHAKKPFKCSVCYQMFASNDELVAHDKNKHSVVYTCEFCPKTFTCKRFMRSHTSFHTKPYQCFHCSRSFSSKIRLRSHVEKHPE